MGGALDLAHAVTKLKTTFDPKMRSNFSCDVDSRTSAQKFRMMTAPSGTKCLTKCIFQRGWVFLLRQKVSKQPEMKKKTENRCVALFCECIYRTTASHDFGADNAVPVRCTYIYHPHSFKSSLHYKQNIIYVDFCCFVLKNGIHILQKCHLAD